MMKKNEIFKNNKVTGAAISGSCTFPEDGKDYV